MPIWLLSLVSTLAWPVLKQLIIFLLRMVEVRFPGLKVFVEAIITYLRNGGDVQALQAHCEALPGFCANK